MTDEIRWTSVASFAALYEAELPRQRLEAAGIPVLVRGAEPGIWGPAFPGPTSRGIELLVPEERVPDAAELLDDDRC